MPIDITLPVEINRPRYSPIHSVEDYGNNQIRITYGTYRDALIFDAVTGLLIDHDETDDNSLRLRQKSEEVAVKQFKIFFGHKDWAKTDWRFLQDESLYLFTDPKQAKAKADELNAESSAAGADWRFMVKSNTIMSANHAWRDWMTSRFESGEYVALPWKDEAWYNPDHFCHAALCDSFKVAYVASIVDGVEDRITVANPGAYLQRFYSDKLTATEIAQWTAKVDSEAELCFAATPEEIVDIYVNGGINSCMRYAADSAQFPLGVQPTSVYGAGDLQLAYLKRRNKIVARALVWPEKKTIGRIYGDSERLRNRLIAEGYTWKDADPSVFDGAKLLRIEVAGEIVLPYLDWNMGAMDSEDDQYLIIVSKARIRAQYPGQSQNGTASGRSIMICGFNGCRTHIVDGAGFYDAHRGRQTCDNCAEQNMVMCVATRHFYMREPGNASYRISQIMGRDGQPLTGLRGGWVHHNYALSDYGYRLIDNQVYLVRDTQPVTPNSRTYCVRPVDVPVPA